MQKIEIESPDGMKIILNTEQEIKDIIYGMRWVNSEHLKFLQEKGLEEEFSKWALKRHYGDKNGR